MSGYRRGEKRAAAPGGKNEGSGLQGENGLQGESDLQGRRIPQGESDLQGENALYGGSALHGRKQNSAMRIMDALSGVDEELLERCEQSGQSRKGYHRPLWQQARAWAAVLCLAVVGAVSFGGYRLTQMGGMGSASSGEENAAYSMETVELADEMVKEDEDAGEEVGVAPQDAAGLDGAAEPLQTSVPLESADEEESEFGEQRQESTADDEKNSNQVAMGTMDPNNGADDGAIEEEMKTETDICLPLQAQKLTEAQARGTEVLGGYIPTVLPKGYGFESASRNLDRQEENLTLCWSRGMDSILLGIEKTETVPATVDIARTESYDERLYEIPYGETVPEEYREIFQDPIFAIEDLSLEVIKSRVISHNDRGDTDTPRGNFRVLYPDGVLVRFNGRGTPEEIWEMFCSMGE